MTIKSQRHFFKFYVSLFFYLLFFLTLALMTGGLHTQARSSAGDIAMLTMSLALVFLAFYTIFRYYRNARQIIINEDSFQFGGTTYDWKDIEKVEFTGKRPFKFFWQDKEGMLLKFSNSVDLFIFDDMYDNSPEMKTFIQGIIGSKTNDIRAKPNILRPDTETLQRIGAEAENGLNPVNNDTASSTKTTRIEIIKYFKGFPLFSLDGIILWGLIVFFMVMGGFDFMKNHHMEGIQTLSALSIIFFIFFSRRFYYFSVSNHTLFVQHYYFFWIKNGYPLDGIKEVVFEQRVRMPIELRIINEDFTTAKYPAASLWSKTWMDMKVYLEQNNVKIRNECGVSYEPFKFKFFND